MLAASSRLTVALGLTVALFAGLAGSAKAGTFVCSSRSGQRTRCETGGYTSVEIVKALTKTACRKGVGWGIDDDGLWVDHGCSARFAGTGGDGAAPEPAAEGQAATDWICASVDKRPGHCVADVSHGI